MRRKAKTRALGGWLVLVGVGWFCGTAPLWAWTPETQVTIAKEAAKLVPPDLARQLEKHPESLRKGALAPFQDGEPNRHMVNPDGSGQLHRVIEAEYQRSIRAIREHEPFEKIVFHLGVLGHYVADLNNPLAVSNADRAEARYFADYLRYAEVSSRKFPLIFYGVEPGLETGKEISPLVSSALERGRLHYGKVGQEYRRIHFASGIGKFDERSTAFGIASVCFSWAINDVMLVWRKVWQEAGGIDSRGQLPERGEKMVRLPRSTLKKKR